ncbi:opioid-binding protein/cell adhesion molecule homolog [Haliotis rubra]|uniref:opioid-binding protein/cell adhesion molecule homolog n=1 Tax=Haliotis rubra TaxID=36100 RepID=UPI001EE5765D|nr:opioid-binding protein/cell adhesion molecule homolog [Haliotis rubra]
MSGCRTGPIRSTPSVSVTRSSRGRYRCTADNGISPPGQANVKVKVHYPPTVHVADTKRVVRELEDLTIQCTAKAKPNVTSVVWTKEGVGARISDNGTLHLKNIQKDDAGVYVCTATNKVNPAREDDRQNARLELLHWRCNMRLRVERFGVTSGAGNTTVRGTRQRDTAV